MSVQKVTVLASFTNELQKIAFDEHAARENRKLDQRTLAGIGIGGAAGAGLGAGSAEVTRHTLLRAARKHGGEGAAKALKHSAALKLLRKAGRRRAGLGALAGVIAGTIAGPGYHGTKNKDAKGYTRMTAGMGAGAGLGAGLGYFKKTKHLRKLKEMRGRVSDKMGQKGLKASSRLIRSGNAGKGAMLGALAGIVGGSAYHEYNKGNK